MALNGMLEAETATTGKLVVKELILENFMSYKYARIPLSLGLNFALGPNGSGKSSILIALSVVLGQSHTERGRKLSDLIRRGEQIARVTLVFDNRPVGGRRPVSEVRSDELVLTRYIKSDGEYWHQINYKPATKMEVEDTLKRFGIDPNNMLIIMQQYMIEEFVVLDPIQKLRLFEGAVGLSPLREKVLASREQLREIASEERSIETMMKEAGNTLEKWRNEYEKLLRRRELLRKESELERELRWALADEKRKQVNGIQSKIASIEERSSRLSTRESENAQKTKAVYIKLDAIRLRYKEIFLKYAGSAEVQRTELSERIVRLDHAITRGIKLYAMGYAKSAVIKLRLRDFGAEQRRLSSKLSGLTEELSSLLSSAEATGQHPDQVRNPDEVNKDIEANRLGIAALGLVIEDADKMYEAYQKSFDDLKGKLDKVKEARQRALEELMGREDIWRDSIMSLVTRLNEKFRSQLESIEAIGDVAVTNIEDIENAGLRIAVGFRGSQPVELNYFTQSGGERSVSVISFLLSLQSFISSPIRAVDEFDVHMDPLNRDAFFKMLSDEAERNPAVCYISITPGRIPEGLRWSTAIVVQNIYGSSSISVVRTNGQ